MSGKTGYRLEGLESDNLLAFLTLLGTLRILDLRDVQQDPARRLSARAAWTLEEPPLRPVLVLNGSPSRNELCAYLADGLSLMVDDFEFGGRRDLDYTGTDARYELQKAIRHASARNRRRADVVAAMMTDAAIKDPKEAIIEATPLCLMFGQGHQHFLERVAEVSKGNPVLVRRKSKTSTPAALLAETLFEPWTRQDDLKSSFRWDAAEDVRYALMAGDPTSAAWKGGTQHAANRLAVAALPVLPTAPIRRGNRVRPLIPGGAFGPQGFSFAWPIWRTPATLPALRAMLTHPRLREPGALEHLGVVHVMVARRISVGKFMNISRARPIGASHRLSDWRPRRAEGMAAPT